ncbi:THUMP domain-containing protein [[Eubacterium] cellulosolvens]
MVLLLIRYNELGLKSPRVRRRFQQQMLRNIEDKFLRAKLDCFIDTDWGRIYLDTNDQAKGIELLSTVFGITSVSPVITTSADIKDITDAVLAYATELLKPDTTFALRTRRTGKHDYTSMELAQVIGKAILDRFAERRLKVDLGSPEHEIHIEVRNKQAYIFSEFFSGPGGLPLGTQGKVICVFTDERAYIASWLMMKRGCRVFPVFFKSVQDKTGANEKMMREQVEVLKSWAANINIKVFETESTTKNDFEANFLENTEFLNYSQKVRVKGLCLSFNLVEFAGVMVNAKNDLPIYYPLIGLDDKKLQELGQKIREPLVN